MSDLIIRTEGKAGRITLNRPHALNALTWPMCLKIEETLLAWRDDPVVQCVIIDGAGDRAFCAGGDIADLYHSLTKGDFAFGQKFWRDEYRLNALIHHFPKPIVTFLHGFTMGGGVGLGCHASHRVVCENSTLSLPECSIGLIPDVGSTYILANSPGHLGEYLGLTGARMSAEDAVFAGFADVYIKQSDWDAVVEEICVTGDMTTLSTAASPITECTLKHQQVAIDAAFGQSDLSAISSCLHQSEGAFATDTAKRLSRNAPLAMAAALRIIRTLRPAPDIDRALDLEYRYTSRAGAQGDFQEGIRAAIIDRDKSPNWRYASISDVTEDDVARMLAPLENGGSKI